MTRDRPITAEAIHRYVDNNAKCCPECDGDNTEGSIHLSLDDTGAICEVKCHDCGLEWTEQYTLTQIRVGDQVFDVPPARKEQS